MLYSAFGLNWKLPFVCPEMGATVVTNNVDVTVCYGPAPALPSGSAGAGPFQQVTPTVAHFRFPEIASYLVEQGNRITIEPEDGATEAQLRLFLLGTAISLLLHQRGLLPFHASGICTSHGAVLFAGHSGFGKSTLLATFLARGYGMLTDDLAAIGFTDAGQPFVYPGYPQIKLWADSANELDQSTDKLRRIRPELDKFAVPLTQEIDRSPIPLHAIYALTPYNGNYPTLEPLTDARKFNIFLDHTWQKLALKRMGRHADHFRQSVAVANQVKVRHVNRPEKPFMLQELANLIEADFVL